MIQWGLATASNWGSVRMFFCLNLSSVLCKVWCWNASWHAMWQDSQRFIEQVICNFLMHFRRGIALVMACTGHRIHGYGYVWHITWMMHAEGVVKPSSCTRQWLWRMVSITEVVAPCPTAQWQTIGPWPLGIFGPVSPGLPHWPCHSN